MTQVKQSKEFLEILKENVDNRLTAIRSISHTTPLLNFWVSPIGEILDEENVHHDNLILGELSGKATYIGDVIYIVICGKNKMDASLTIPELALFRRSYPSLLFAVENKNPNISKEDICNAQFISERGESIK